MIKVVSQPSAQDLMQGFAEKKPAEQIQLLEKLKLRVNQAFLTGTPEQKADVLSNVFPVLEKTVKDASIWGGLEGGEKIDVARKCLDVASHVTSVEAVYLFVNTLKHASPEIRASVMEYTADLAGRIWKSGKPGLVSIMKDAFVPIVESIASGKMELKPQDGIADYPDVMRFRAIETLGKIAAGRSMGTLTGILNDKKTKMVHRTAAAESLLEVLEQHENTTNPTPLGFHSQVLRDMTKSLNERALDPDENPVLRGKIISNMWRAGTTFTDDLREVVRNHSQFKQQALETLKRMYPDR